ncbi:MAG: hypothetical protein IPO69_00575 [Saprospiraceae bacterium]|nr:hypothetical protein [Saprospiraceae bacterium]
MPLLHRTKYLQENEIDTFKAQTAFGLKKQPIEHAVKEEVDRLKREPATGKSGGQKVFYQPAGSQFVVFRLFNPNYFGLFLRLWLYE